MKKLLLASLILSVSPWVSADEYQSITKLAVTHQSFDFEDATTTSLESKYYFDARSVLGPYNEFSFINTHSYVSARVSNSDYYDGYSGVTDYGVGGEFFLNNFVIGADASRSNNEHEFLGDFDYNSYSASFGYLFSNDLTARIRYHDTNIDGNDGFFTADAQYNLTLNNTDYIGFTVNTDEDFDNYGVGTKYFSDLGEERYLTAQLDISSGVIDEWTLSSNFYFSKTTSIFGSYHSSDAGNDRAAYTFGGEHFFNKHWALLGSYTRVNDDYDIGQYDENVYKLAVTAQF